MPPKQPGTPQSPEDANARLETGGEHGGGWDGEPTIPDEAAGANWNDLREDDDAAEVLVAQSLPTPKAPTPKKPEGAFDQTRLGIRPSLPAARTETKQSPRLVIVEAEVAAAQRRRQPRWRALRNSLQGAGPVRNSLLGADQQSKQRVGLARRDAMTVRRWRPARRRRWPGCSWRRLVSKGSCC